MLFLITSLVVFLCIFKKNINYHYIFDLLQNKKRLEQIDNNLQLPVSRYIAHAGGQIDQYKYTNSLEAVLNSCNFKIKYIELDIQESSDGNLVAVHDWELYNKMIGNDDLSFIPNLHQFSANKFYLKYTPLVLTDGVSILEKKSIYLVTDKIDNLILLKKIVKHYITSVIVEVFSIEKYNEAIDLGFVHVALNVSINKLFLPQWLKLNNVKLVTYRGDKSSKNYIIEKNIKSIDKLGINSLIYFTDHIRFELIQKYKNTKIYIDNLDSNNKCIN